MQLIKNITKTAIAAAALFSASTAMAKETLTVYTYSSFTSEWGIGPKVKEAFEAQCACELKFVSLEDGVSMLNRVRLEGENSAADVVVGLDANLALGAEATGLFANHGLDLAGLGTPNDWKSDIFVPFDYGYFGFVYNEKSVKNPPKSMQELIDAPDDLKIVIQDPRTSTPGYGLLLWMKAIYGDKAADMWKKLSPKIVTVTKGWSDAYFNIFQKGEADMVLSYTTSPAYHMTVEEDMTYHAAPFAEGHYLQLEIAAKLKSAKQPKLADQFLKFLTSNDFQKLVPTGQWMYRLGEGKDGVPASFDQLVKPSKVLLLDAKIVEAENKAWISEWQNALK